MHITICICTYHRPELLGQLLNEVARQRTNNLFNISIVVADNDEAQSAKRVVREISESISLKVIYCVEPRRNISFARNKTLENATGDFIAFIDDDELPDKDWLLNLYNACNKYNVAGVLGPVRPRFVETPPSWILKGKIFERPEHGTGFIVPERECRTGNVLFRKSIIDGVDPVFRPEFGTGGGDVDFFKRMIAAGYKFIWCNEAVVHEVVPPSRCKRSFMIKRALLRGKNVMRHPETRMSIAVKAFIAVPCYTFILPFLQIAGHHHFMKFLIKLCDHAGALLALIKMNPIREREM
jgi:glycosyltransferase involved in cell wall biosynthesis